MRLLFFFIIISVYDYGWYTTYLVPSIQTLVPVSFNVCGHISNFLQKFIFILPTLGSASLTTNHSLNLFSGSLFYLVMCVCTIALIFAFSINACLTSVDQRAVRDNCFLLNLTLSLASARAVVLRYFSKPFK